MLAAWSSNERRNKVLKNQYGARCALCETWVEPLMGTAHKGARRWVVMHVTCPDAAAPVDADDADDEDDEDAPLDAGFDVAAEPQPLNATEQVAWLQFALTFKTLAGIVASAGLTPDEEAARKPQLVEMVLLQLPAEARRTLQQDAALERFTRFLLALGDSSLAQAVETL